MARMYGAGLESFDRAMAPVDSLIVLNHDRADAARIQADEITARARWIVLVVLGLALAVGIGLALSVGAKIAGPMEKVARAAERIAEGDLTVEVKVSGRDEVAWLGSSFNKTTTRLRGSMAGIAHSATSLAATAEELTHVSQTMSAGAEKTSVQANVRG
jgi:methyl-accepting chemotaxis protein